MEETSRKEKEEEEEEKLGISMVAKKWAFVWPHEAA